MWHQDGFSLLNYKDDARPHKHKIHRVSTLQSPVQQSDAECDNRVSVHRFL